MRSIVTLELKGSLDTPGFRPFIWQQISRTRLGGWVSDSIDGTLLRLEGEDSEITDFLQKLPAKLTRQFNLNSIRLLKRTPAPAAEESPKPFKLIGPVFYDGIIEPNRAPCADCVKRMLDPKSDCYHYPFLSCSKCGPRYSVANLADFSRATSAFRAFPPCADCAESVNRAKAGDPHGNFIEACPKCGPNVFLIFPGKDSAGDGSPVETAARMIDEGKIAAVKTYDGFVLTCDPFRADSIRTIRKRRGQPDKPISLMMRDLESVRKYCVCSGLEEKLLTSPAAPVVVLQLRENSPLDGTLFCPDNPHTVGVALPSSAILRLLMECRPDGTGGFRPFEVLVCTGGPHPVDPEDAGGDEDLQEVSHVADVIVMHDLKIWHSSGPSVQFEVPELGLMTVRRSGGLCPTPLPLKQILKRTVLAFGSDSCAAVALGFRNKVILSHQMGEIRTMRNSRALSLTAERLVLLFARIPDIIVCDMDRCDLSAQRALLISERYRVPLATAQRHHANALACLVEHGLDGALALVFDGGAAGPDGTVWGAELLEVSFTAFRRLASFAPAAMRRPRERSLYPSFILSRYVDAAGSELPERWRKILNVPPQVFAKWKTSPTFANTRETHAALTLFDAAAAVIGIAPVFKTFDQQVMLRFEALLSEGYDVRAAEELSALFPFRMKVSDECAFIDWSGFFRNLDSFADAREKYRKADLAAAFLTAVAKAAVRMTEYGTGLSPMRDIVLSGKAFLMPSFLRITQKHLTEAGYRVFRHEQTSPDESSVSIGQAVFGGMA